MVLIEHPRVLIGRQYHYDTTGNLIRTDDKLNGNTDYAYDPLGRILQAADERFAFDPAHNISDDGQSIMGNRLMEYNGVHYRYDGLGNLTERHSHTESQFYRYDADNQLIEARIEKANSPTQYWQYRYDPFGRRISKTNVKTQQNTQFVWEGSRLLQELRQDKVYTYVYTEQNSYEPLAQIETFRQPESEKASTQPKVYYYHTDQIGIPREMTDETGKIVWQGRYSAWGKLLHEEKANNSIHQPFRLQNQYADEETGLHYNFFRYYDPHCGRFTQQDPIGLMGGENLYAFAKNVQIFIDILGLNNREVISLGSGYKGNVDTFTYKGKTSFEIHVLDSKGKEVGIYGPNGWFNKHGLKGRPENIPANVENACRGKSVEIGRRLKAVPPKGTANIKGNNLKKLLSALLPVKVITFLGLAEPSPNKACTGMYGEINHETCTIIGVGE